MAKDISETGKVFPHDRGWAWVIAFAGMGNLMTGVGVYRSLGILAVELMDIYDAPVSKASLLFSYNSLGYAISAVLYIFGLGHIVHERALVAASGFMSSVGFVVTFFSSRLEHVFFLAFFLGLGNQIGVASGLGLISKYFEKKRSVANGIALAGVSVGVLIFPPGIQWLLDTYTYRGAALILAGISLHSLVFCALMRPVLVHQKPRKGDRQRLEIASIENDSHLKALNGPCLGTNVEDSYVAPNSPLPEKTSMKMVNSKVHNPSTAEKPRKSPKMPTHNALSDDELPHQSPSQSLENKGKRHRVEVHIHTVTGVSRSGNLNKAFSCETGDTQQDMTHEPERLLAPRPSLKKDTRISKSSTKEALEDIKRFIFFDTKDQTEHLSVLKTLKSGLLMFKSPLQLIIQLFMFFSTCGSENVVQFFPAFSTELGLTEYQTAFLMSVIGVGDFISRVGFGILGDCNIMKRYQLVLIPQIVLGSACFLSVLCKDIWSQAIFAAVVGLTYGAGYAFRAVILIDFFGLPDLPKTIGISNFMGAVGFLVGSPVIGLLRDKTGNFKVPLQVLGAIFFIGGVVLVTGGIMDAYRRRRRAVFDVET